MSFVLSKKDQIKARIVMLTEDRVEMVNQSLALTPGSDERTIVPTYIIHPPLLVQLADATSRSTAGGSASGAASKPVANLVPLDALNLIKEEAAAWISFYFRQRPRKVGENLRRIYEQIDLVKEGSDLHQLDVESKHWVALALITSTWDKAPMKPYIVCPECSTLASIQVRVEPLCAVCMECRATWDDATIDALGQAVQQRGTDGRGGSEGETRAEHPEALHNGSQIA